MKNKHLLLSLLWPALMISTLTAQNIGINTLNPQAALDINGDVVFRTSDMEVADSITTALDVNTEKFSSYRITADSAITIAGLTAGIDGRVITLINESDFPLEVRNEDTLALEANQVITGDQQSLILEHMGMVTLQYDTSAQKWLVNSSNQVPAGATVWDTTSTGIYIEEFVGIGTDSPVAPLTIFTDLDEPGFTHTAGEDSVTVESSISALLGAVGTSSNHMFTLKSNNEGGAHLTPSGNFIIGSTVQASQFVGANATRMPEFDSKVVVYTTEEPNQSGFVHKGFNDIIYDESTGGVSASVGTMSNHTFRLKTNGEAKFNIYPDGKCWIGPGSAGANAPLTIWGPNNDYGFTLLGQSDQMLGIKMGGPAGSVGIGTYTPHNLRLVCNGENALSIRPDGAIGINTDDPVEQLTVFTNGPGHGISHRTSNGIVMSSHIGTENTSFGTRTFNSLRLVTNDITRVHIDETGKIGIGTLNPLNLFEVKGIMRAQELIIETANWPDYVFADDYHLLPLNEIEKYIDEHKHLPNIQSAAEMENNGVHVGDTQKKMMEKIEELTLYIIELNKRIESLEKNKQ